MKIPLIILILVFLAAGAWAQPTSALVDPLRPSHHQPRPQPEPRPNQENLVQLGDRFRVTAILWATDRAVAIINGQPLRVGQVIGDFRLTKIGPDHVVLEKEQQKLTLYRSVGDVQKSPATGGATP